MTTKTLFNGFSLVLFALLQYQLWLAPGSLLEVWHLNQESKQLEQINQMLYEKNLLLAADVEDLKSGEESVEERARYELGMVKQFEEFYQIIQ